MTTGEMKSWTDRLNNIPTNRCTVKTDRLASFQSDLSSIYGRHVCMADRHARKLYEAAEERY